MSKLFYFHSAELVLLILIALYLVNYYFFNVKEGVSLISGIQNQSGITASNASQATFTPATTPSNYSATTSLPVQSQVQAQAQAPVNEYQERKQSSSYAFDASNNKYGDVINNLNIKYHDDYETKKDDYGNPAGTAYIVDKKGNTTAIPPTGLGTSPTFYKPKDYVYGSLTYVPNYEDSVYLSRTANMYIGKPIVETSAVQSGMCNYYKNNPDQLEQACQKTDTSVCASTSCCVLLGGAKCVSGNENGPKMKSHYSNTMIPNRDFYYFQSKCYGNCPRE